MFIEATREDREQMKENGIFDINGNIPMHPNYCGIHQLSNGCFVRRERSDYGTANWVGNQIAITNQQHIEKIKTHMSKSCQ